MSVQKTPSQTMIPDIASNIFQAMPLLKKRLVKLNAVQLEQGIPLSHVQVLALLAESGQMSITEISRRFGIAKPNITPLVDRLVNAGLVDRVRSTEDRRVVNVVILDAGREKLETIQTALNEHVASWSSSISEQDCIDLDQALKTVVRVLEQI